VNITVAEGSVISEQEQAKHRTLIHDYGQQNQVHFFGDAVRARWRSFWCLRGVHEFNAS